MTTTSKSHPGVSGRLRWLPKAELVEVLNLRPGMTIAEIGAGAGDLILEASQAVGPEGRAFAIEADSEQAARLRDRVRDHRNVTAIESPLLATPIPAASCDRVLMANLWANLPAPLAALQEAARLLREDGRLIVVEWHAAAQCPEAPDQRIAFHEMVRFLERSAWDIHSHGDLGPYSYFLEAGVSDESVQS